jgi:CRISPR-associated protein Cas2
VFIILVLISYDISTLTPEGATRLRRVAKECQNYAQRVQNSVFEANLDYGTFIKLKAKLEKIIDKEEDSLRFYYLGNNWKNKVEHIGTKKSYNPEGILIL